MATPSRQIAIHPSISFLAALVLGSLCTPTSTWAQNGVQLNNPILGPPIQTGASQITSATQPAAAAIGSPYNVAPNNLSPQNLQQQNRIPQNLGPQFPNPANAYSQRINPNLVPANQAQPDIANPNGTPPRIGNPEMPNPNSSPRFVTPDFNSAVNPQNGSPNSPTIRPTYAPTQTTTRSKNGAEIIRERYPNGATKIEREVVQDKNKNFINHGEWKLFLPNGRVTAKAQFQFGKKFGEWARWLTTAESPTLRVAPFNQFKSPFLSTFQYTDDQLNGVWQLVDSANRKVFEINLQNGKRESVARFFFANGRNFKLMTYRNGLLDGPFQVWNPQGQLIENRKFQDGHEVGKITEYYPTLVGRNKAKKLEFDVLAGEIAIVQTDDPWNLRFAVENKVGVDLKNGNVEAWYPNGQLKLTGKYEQDMQNGVFAWYFQNGQKQAEGKLIDGERVGEWTWWHQNGMRASSGQYVAGKPAGDWQWWMADGKLNKSKSFDGLEENSDIPSLQNASYQNLPPTNSGDK
jgi:antitoxin component YwqK of YwqJK toxin-antitoxin module